MEDKKIYQLIKDETQAAAKPNLAELYERIEKCDEIEIEQTLPQSKRLPKYAAAVISTAAALILVFFAAVLMPNSLRDLASEESAVMNDSAMVQENVPEFGEEDNSPDFSVGDDFMNYGSVVDGSTANGDAAEDDEHTDSTTAVPESNDAANGNVLESQKENDAYQTTSSNADTVFAVIIAAFASFAILAAVFLVKKRLPVKKKGF